MATGGGQIINGKIQAVEEETQYGNRARIFRINKDLFVLKLYYFFAFSAKAGPNHSFRCFYATWDYQLNRPVM